MQSPFVRERYVQTPNGAELHLYLRSYDYLVEMAGELGRDPQTRDEQVENSIRSYMQDKYPNMPIKRVKLFVGSMLLTTLTFAGAFGGGAGLATAQAAAAQIGLVVNGKAISGTNPYNQNGRTMVPVRAIAEALGASVSWEQATQTVTMTQSGTTVTLRIGSTTATVNGRSVTLDAAPVNQSGTVYVPVRFVSEALGANVAWDSYRNTVVISNQATDLYTAKSGDTLWNLSQALGVSFASLLQLNGMTNQTALYPGEQLLVPHTAATGAGTEPATQPTTATAPSTYTVASGDSLWKIATRFGTTVAALQAANNLMTDTLQVGQRLTIPSAGTTPTTPTAPTTTTPTTPTTYTVASGDSLWKIATQFGTTVAALKAANNLTTDVLQVGETLTLPSGATGTPTPTAPTGTTTTQTGEYIVQPGDSLWALANRFNTSVSAIMQASGITSDALFVGQRLEIPGYTPAPPPPAASYLEGTDPRARAQLGQETYIFPFADPKSYTPFRDTWGESRAWNPDGSAPRAHSGTDILAPEGTPVVAVGSGTIINYGWNEYGGWRVTIRLDGTDYAVYYAHLSRYAPGLAKGVHVNPGQVLGYVGSTGYGPVGTSGKFVSHLHFGVYDVPNGFTAINSYPFLKYWEAR